MTHEPYITVVPMSAQILQYNFTFWVNGLHAKGKKNWGSEETDCFQWTLFDKLMIVSTKMVRMETFFSLFKWSDDEKTKMKEKNSNQTKRVWLAMWKRTNWTIIQILFSCSSLFPIRKLLLLFTSSVRYVVQCKFVLHFF